MSDAKPADAAAPAKSSNKLIIIIAAAVLVLGGGGAGAWFAFSGKEEPKKEAEGESKEKHDENHATKLPAQFVTLDPPFVVNFSAGSPVRFLQIAAQLMTRDPHMAEFLEHNTPIIRNDLLLLFGNKLPDEVASNEGKEALRVAALEAVRKIIKAEGENPEALEGIYFTSFVMQ